MTSKYDLDYYVKYRDEEELQADHILELLNNIFYINPYYISNDYFEVKEQITDEMMKMRIFCDFENNTFYIKNRKKSMKIIPYVYEGNNPLKIDIEDINVIEDVEYFDTNRLRIFNFIKENYSYRTFSYMCCKETEGELSRYCDEKDDDYDEEEAE